MTAHTRNILLKEAKELFAVAGYEGFSMRNLAKKSGVGLSSIYHFFNDKDELLKIIFDDTGKQLGIERAKLPTRKTASAMLKDRIRFQFDHIEDVVFVLKYYLHFRPEFLKLKYGYIPTKAYLHIDEVIRKGVSTGEFVLDHSSVDKESKIVAHAINGFLLEYYPVTPQKKERNEVIRSIHTFLMRSLSNREVVSM